MYNFQLILSVRVSDHITRKLEIQRLQTWRTNVTNQLYTEMKNAEKVIVTKQCEFHLSNRESLKVIRYKHK